jgi:aldehyde dehydrogenase (NAD+)
MDYGLKRKLTLKRERGDIRGFGHFVGGSELASGGYFDPAGAGDGGGRAGGRRRGDVWMRGAARRPGRGGSRGAGAAFHGRAHGAANGRLLAVLEALDNGKPIRGPAISMYARRAPPLITRMGAAPGARTADQLVGASGRSSPELRCRCWPERCGTAPGNTVVPGRSSPRLGAVARRAGAGGLPPGVLNVVTGDGSTGALLVEHADVDKIAFTGSTEVGRLIRAQTAGSGKALTLELGGKSPFIVFDDADIDGAIEGVVDAIWFNQGQVCCAGSRLLLQEGIAETFLSRLKRRMGTLRVGHPLDKAIDMGAIVAPVQLERIRALVATGVAEGAALFQPESADWKALPAGGCFYPPTLLAGVHPSATVAREEIFGPVLVSMTFRTPDEAVMLANNSRYGLSASVWSETIGLALDVAPKLQVGVVWVNATNLFDAAVGFGGYRESGFGREGGREGVYEYLKPKAWAGRKPRAAEPVPTLRVASTGFEPPSIDRTAKLFIGGKQARPDGNYSRPVLSPKGALVGEVGEGNRKDIRNAVAAARAAEGWSRATRAQPGADLYYLAENLSARAPEPAGRIGARPGVAGEGGGRGGSRSRASSTAPGGQKFEGAGACARRAAWRWRCTSRSAWAWSARTRRRCWPCQPGGAARRHGHRVVPCRASAIRCRPISTR